MRIDRAFFIGPHVDENKCVEEATRAFKQTKKKSMIHHHRFQDQCNDQCYLAPKEKKKEEDTNRAFN